MADDKQNNQNRFWLIVALGIAFLVLAGGAAFLTGYLLLGERDDAGALVALAVIAAAVTGIGVAVLLLVALIFQRKAKK